MGKGKGSTVVRVINEEIVVNPRDQSRMARWQLDKPQKGWVSASNFEPLDDPAAGTGAGAEGSSNGTSKRNDGADLDNAPGRLGLESLPI